MVVEPGFLSGCMVSLCYQGHLTACPTRPEGPYEALACQYHQAYGGPCLPTLTPEMEAGVGCGQGPYSSPLPEDPNHLRHGAGWAVGQGWVDGDLGRWGIGSSP